ncbi:hypothetical protein TWF694_001142 [Orbilia ellipsospora]|uniref:TeaA receptor TeaR n=1 Tax=Orbilia ellipsospora TaxID=2528407 RepID=A0AAV9XU35_9PEZI
MTSITASRGIANITPPSSSHGQRDWDYSVPIDAPEDDGNTYYSYTNNNRNGGATRSRASSSTTKVKSVMETRKPSYNRSNSDYTKDTPRSQNIHPSEVSPDDFLVAPRAPALAPRGADGRDSAMDMYSTNRLSTISHATDILPNINSSATAMYDLSGDIDNREASSWIHRDKLMRIESVEFKKSPATPTEAWVKTASRKLSMDQMSKVTRGSTWENNSFRYTTGGEDESNEAFENGDFDLRLPEEREVERVAQSKLAAARSRSVTPSKIPVNLASPAPIPLQFFERNSPLKRARSDSLEEDAQSISYPATRTRSRTVESSEQPPVTPPEKSAPTTSHSATPPSKITTRTPSKNSPRRPTSSHRTSAAGGKGAQKPRTVSSAGNRGSGGNTNSASIAKPINTPEGPPPWAMGSYTTDPKLPPDQQIIPTVAKRLQQEQWEREGAPASVFDRELRPLKLHDKDMEPKEAINFGEQSAQWPKINEKQRDPPPMVEPPKSERQETPKPPTKEPIRVKDPEQAPGKGAKDKGCCGCTIM